MMQQKAGDQSQDVLKGAHTGAQRLLVLVGLKGVNLHEHKGVNMHTLLCEQS